MGRPPSLLRWTRSRWHRRWFRASALGCAFVVGIGLPGGALLAATHPETHSTLWTVALVAVIVVTAVAAAVAVVAGVGAFVTQPVSDSHCATLKASALSVARSIQGDRACDYGEGYRPDLAFHSHFPKLGERLMARDGLVVAPAQAQGALERQIDTTMTEWGVTDAEMVVGYNIPEIMKYARGLAMARARGQVQEVPHLTWAGFTNAPPTAGGQVIGPPEGQLRPNGGPDWISLRPLDGETAPQWNERADVYTQRVDGLMAAVYETALPYAHPVVAAEQQLEAFKQDERPTILAALQLIAVREPPRVRRGCESC
jgi:hypothetical protein